MPVTHSELFHSWRIRPGSGGAAARPPGGSAGGRRHCFWIAPVTCLKQFTAAARGPGRQAPPGRSPRFREGPHGARRGPDESR